MNFYRHVPPTSNIINYYDYWKYSYNFNILFFVPAQKNGKVFSRMKIINNHFYLWGYFPFSRHQDFLLMFMLFMITFIFRGIFCFFHAHFCIHFFICRSHTAFRALTRFITCNFWMHRANINFRHLVMVHSHFC